jgi:hypothetical protein
VPLGALRAEYRRGEELRITLTRLAQRFKVSTPIILRRIHDLGVVAPVRLPSGRLRLVTSPRSIGSPAVKKTIGIVLGDPRKQTLHVGSSWRRGEIV